MIECKATTKFSGKKVQAKARKANFENLGHAAASIRITARHGIKKGQKPSAPGTPPHTKKGQLRGAIVYAVEKDKQSGVIGPDVGKAGTSGQAHEFGGRYKGGKYDKRPFMRPALEKTKDRLPKFWQGSVR